MAYGQSAYALRLYAKANNYSSLRAYSTELNLPCTVVSQKTIKSLRNILPIVNEIEREMVVFELEKSFEYQDYLMWTDKLRVDNELGEHTIVIKTIVSDKVPKGVFIEDGMCTFSRYMKRLFDFFVASVTLIIFSPLMLICYLAIKMDDGGPAIYAQERIGRFGRKFKIYKFRSMRMDAEKAGPQLSAQQGKGAID